MKVTERLNVSANDLYEHLLESIRYDYREATGKQLKASRLKRGLGYRKQLRAKAGGDRDVAVKVTELERPRVYEATFTSSQGVNTIRWEIEPTGDGTGVTVAYEEDFEGAKTLGTWNHKLLSTLMSPGSKRRIRQRMRAIEGHIRARNYEVGEADAASDAPPPSDDTNISASSKE